MPQPYLQIIRPLYSIRHRSSQPQEACISIPQKLHDITLCGVDMRPSTSKPPYDSTPEGMHDVDTEASHPPFCTISEGQPITCLHRISQIVTAEGISPNILAYSSVEDPDWGRKLMTCGGQAYGSCTENAEMVVLTGIAESGISRRRLLT